MEKLCVYELQQKWINVSTEISLTETIYKPKMCFQFVLQHELDTDNSFMFLHMHSIDVDPMAYYRANVSQIKIDDHGVVKLCYVENLPIANVKDIDS